MIINNTNLASVLGNLQRPEEYIRSVHANLRKQRDAYPNIVVSIDGTAGRIDPHYIFHRAKENSDGSRTRYFLQAFDGRTHEASPELRNSVKWSAAEMTVAELLELYSRCRADDQITLFR